MNCPICGALLLEGSCYCARCGAEVNQTGIRVFYSGGSGSPPGNSADAQSSGDLEAEETPSAVPPAAARFVEPPVARQAAEPPEQVLWEGGYSGKDMYETWTLYALLSLLLLGLSLWAQTAWVGWASVVVIVLLWVYGTLVLLYRKLSVSYRLTTRRFLHEKGFLWRVRDRIELIDIDDVTLKQSPIDRLVGVGNIILTSSDRTHPVLVLHGIKDATKIADLIDNARLEERRRRAVHMETV
ncbi:MAG: PH domain-containing protein [Thermoguttaceae bacterium]|nr:PH domain-containing protein [Thermoguttaceae bacterium]MDW8038138.1 PH domain-containing protein [Thermoguttaceae bacterium]